jgi:hypothetical protein
MINQNSLKVEYRLYKKQDHPGSGGEIMIQAIKYHKKFYYHLVRLIQNFLNFKKMLPFS